VIYLTRLVYLQFAVRTVFACARAHDQHPVAPGERGEATSSLRYPLMRFTGARDCRGRTDARHLRGPPADPL